MIDRFNDIIDVEFTANMEAQLDDVEAGSRQWKELLRDFYAGFSKELLDAEKALEGTRLKVPDEPTNEVCEICGRNMVIKIGRFGRFMACPGFPECTNTKPLVERMPGRCPKCGHGMLKLKSRKGFTFYGCETGTDCGFMSWDVPTEFDCPTCGQTLFKKSGRGRKKPFCINEQCANFLPEDQRGYYKKKPAQEDGQTATPAPEAEGESAPKTTKRSATKTDNTTKEKKTTTKKSATRTAAAKETATDGEKKGRTSKKKKEE